MILTDNVNTFTDTHADERADPIWNSNIQVTIGGVVKQQADSQRLRITYKGRLTQAQLKSLSDILANFSQTLYYTPGRALYDRTTAAQIRVTAEAPEIEQRAYNGGIVFYVTVVFEEVIG